MKAIALFSGGLDSALAIKLIQKQNITVEALYIDIGFETNKEKIEFLKRASEKLNVKLHIEDIKDEYIKNILFSPKYGYGKNLNPCIDCHANMIKVAKNIMEKIDAKFIINGEVVGQRPMSQRLPAMNAVTNLSGAKGLILRPLSAKLLPPTIAEIKGWVEREKLLGISGRERRVQLELAKKYNIEDFIESPGGGCLLTDANFSKRVIDLKNSLGFSSKEIDILKVGRHFNINGYKIIISRNKDENPVLKNYKGDLFEIMTCNNFPGPVGLIQKNTSQDIKQLASDMMVSYTKFEKGEILIGNKKYLGEKKDKKEFSKYII
ncbi:MULTISPECIES: argininosuccinate synthase domain-containing protein [unclassified Lebetimonas]|uniref:argininosuccinate synthase domain-containing protein n=1 Tax=unclassified Lebetimonas TaxID=2648158 RepID=UPI0004631BBB|nr:MULTISPECIES: argininosuccinate synthase domain-containing protein [unclassified Lebetimonas]